jgi:hypothetical protein
MTGHEILVERFRGRVGGVVFRNGMCGGKGDERKERTRLEILYREKLVDISSEVEYLLGYQRLRNRDIENTFE